MTIAIHTVELIHKRKYCNTLEETLLNNQLNSDEMFSRNAFSNIKSQAGNLYSICECISGMMS